MLIVAQRMQIDRLSFRNRQNASLYNTTRALLRVWASSPAQQSYSAIVHVQYCFVHIFRQTIEPLRCTPPRPCLLAQEQDQLDRFWTAGGSRVCGSNSNNRTIRSMLQRLLPLTLLWECVPGATWYISTDLSDKSVASIYIYSTKSLTIVIITASEALIA